MSRRQTLSLRIRSAVSVFSAAVVAFPAHATWTPPPPPVPEVTVKLGDLLGLSVAEVRARLRLRATDVPYVSAVEARDGAEIWVLAGDDLARAGSTLEVKPRAYVSATKGDGRRYHPHFRFENGRLVSALEPASDVVIGPDWAVQSFFYPPNKDQATIASMVFHGVVFSPLIAGYALTLPPKIIRRDAAQSQLARLRLGEPPPGGLARYRLALPGSVTASDAADGAVLLTVNFGRDRILKSDALVRVTVIDGRVARIEKDLRNTSICAVSPERALRCDLPKP